MWNILMMSLAVLTSIPILGQHRILLQDRTTIEDVRIHEIKESLVVYEKKGSLHDVEKEEIRQIVLEKQVLIFLSDGSPIYKEHAEVYTTSTFAPPKKRLLQNRRRRSPSEFSSRSHRRAKDR